jgi:mannose-6-phosphate isomerase-like protein (cupin superfamily)
MVHRQRAEAQDAESSKRVIGGTPGLKARMVSNEVIGAQTKESGEPESELNNFPSSTHLDFKVLTKDTQAGLFLIEHRNIPQGGPVLHLHYAQEEWFYLIEGNKVVIEVGDERFTLRPGHSILAPRNVPHVWAYVGENPGRMLMGFTPAGQMEDFFILSSKHPVDAKIAEAHGMKWLGPPLEISKLVG